MINVQIVDDIWGTIQWILEFIVAIVNILVVIYIYWKDRSRYKKEYSSQVYNYWFHNLLLNDNLENINSFFTNYRNIVSSTDTFPEKYKQITEINKKFDNEVIEIVFIINYDLGQFFNCETERLRDYIVARCENMEQQPALRDDIIKQSNEEITARRNNILKRLYNNDLCRSPYKG